MLVYTLESLAAKKDRILVDFVYCGRGNGRLPIQKNGNYNQRKDLYIVNPTKLMPVKRLPNYNSVQNRKKDCKITPHFWV
jgi:hypothetical protein